MTAEFVFTLVKLSFFPQKTQASIPWHLEFGGVLPV